MQIVRPSFEVVERLLYGLVPAKLMDIYRFFHPHHNPRLHSTPLRQQELSELEQAASELMKAIERARRRSERKAVGPILPQHFTDILKAMRFVVCSLETLCDAHPGDSPDVLRELTDERSDLSGWEAWTSLVKQQLAATAQQIPDAPTKDLRVEGESEKSSKWTEAFSANAGLPLNKAKLESLAKLGRSQRQTGTN